MKPWWSRHLSSSAKSLLVRIAREEQARGHTSTLTSLLRRGLVRQSSGGHELTDRGRDVLGDTVADIPEYAQRTCAHCGLVIDDRDVEQVEFYKTHTVGLGPAADRCTGASEAW